MRSALQIHLPDIDDAGIRELIDDLCEMLSWQADHYPEHTLRDFLESVFRDDPKRVGLRFILVPRVLHRKLGKLQAHSVHALCRELKNVHGLEDFSGRTLLLFLEKHFKDQRKPLPKRRRW